MELLQNLLSLDNNEGLYFVDNQPKSPSPEPSEDTLFKTFKTKGRYFEDPNPLIKCYNCNEPGHMSNSCPVHVKKRCNLCRNKGHNAFDCPLMVCHRCLGIGHKNRACKADLSKRCPVCEREGHSSRNCLARKSPASSSQLKHLKCLYCLKPGHANCFSAKVHSGVYCSRCGSKGHTRSNCKPPTKRMQDKCKVVRK